ncbi:MAG: uncharacterized protein K0S45_1866 [Nitrospira sp.]|nr:uncharacterized protein [Nitrospira sp.]
MATHLLVDGYNLLGVAEQREFQSGVEVFYSKRGERADQVIQRLARLYGRDCAVVSSDHEVANAARAAGAFVMGAPEFRAKLSDRSSGTPAVAFKELDDGEGDVGKRSTEKRGNPRKLPKSQRKRNHQLREF